MKIFGKRETSYVIVHMDFRLFLHYELAKSNWKIEKEWSIPFTPFEVLKVSYQ